MISEMVLNILLPFCFTYLGKMTFLAFKIIKSKYQSVLKNLLTVLYVLQYKAFAKISSLCRNEHINLSLQILFNL